VQRLDFRTVGDRKSVHRPCITRVRSRYPLPRPKHFRLEPLEPQPAVALEGTGTLVRVLCEPVRAWTTIGGRIVRRAKSTCRFTELGQGAWDLGNTRGFFTSVPSVMGSKGISGSYRYVPNFINEDEEAYLLRKVDPSPMMSPIQEDTDPIRRRLPKVLNRNGGM
jgi:hypothetical protein